MSYNILTLNKIAACGTSLLDENYTVTDSCDAPDGILVRSAVMHEMNFKENLLAIGRAGAGVNNIPLDKCSEQGVCVFNTPGANANAVKELVLTGLFLSSRRIPAAMTWVKTLKGKGAEVSKLVEKGKSQFTGPEILGKTLGVIGLGAIGVKVANAAISLGMNVYGFDPFLSVNAAWNLSPKVKHANDIGEVFANADYLTLHLPANKDTRGMIGASALASMKPGIRILNFSRDELIDETAILSALIEGKVACYVTDFPTDAMLELENVVSIPHLGASTPEAEDNCAMMAVQQLKEYLETGNIVNSVNLPNAEMNAENTKVCIIHKNIPAVLSGITTVFGNKGINIENMLNKSKKDMAYSMFDVIGNVSGGDIVSALQGVEGVIRVRIIEK